VLEEDPERVPAPATPAIRRRRPSAKADSVADRPVANPVDREDRRKEGKPLAPRGGSRMTRMVNRGGVSVACPNPSGPELPAEAPAGSSGRHAG